MVFLWCDATQNNAQRPNLTPTQYMALKIMLTETQLDPYSIYGFENNAQRPNLTSTQNMALKILLTETQLDPYSIYGFENQRTNGPVNAHLISWPTLVNHKHIKPEKYMVKK